MKKKLQPAILHPDLKEPEIQARLASGSSCVLTRGSQYSFT